MREVVTLQFGEQANFIGTHYWNTQAFYLGNADTAGSCVDSDVSHRSWIAADGTDSSVPRALLYDLKGSFGTLHGDLALDVLHQQNEPPSDGPWSGRTIPLQLPRVAQSLYQQALSQGLELPTLTTENVRYWSDYNHVFYHPDSLIPLSGHDMNSALMPLESWQAGVDMFQGLDREHDLLDRDLRPLLEACDQLQGIQLIASSDNAWGGFVSQYLEHIADDLDKTARWIFGPQDSNPVSAGSRSTRFANMVQTLSTINGTASMYIPLASSDSHAMPKSITMDIRSKWHTAALQAVAIESFTLPTRLVTTESGQTTFNAMEAILNSSGKRRIADCSFSFDDPERLAELHQPNGQGQQVTNGSLATFLDTRQVEGKLNVQLYPKHTISTRVRHRGLHLFGSIQTLRGPWNNATEIQNMIDSGRGADGTRVAVYQTELMYPDLPSFPKIFTLDASTSPLAIDVKLETSTTIGNDLRNVEYMARRVLGVNEREAVCDALATMAEEYEEGWMSDDESEDE